MRATDIRQGMKIRLRDGLVAEVLDNRRGNARRVRALGVIFGDDEGDVAIYDFLEVDAGGGRWEPIEFSETQRNARSINDALDGFGRPGRDAPSTNRPRS